SIFIIIIISFDAFFAFVYQSKITMFILSSIFETNLIEAKEAISQIVVVVVLILSVTGFLIIAAQRELKKCNISRKRSALILLIYFVVVIPPLAAVKTKKDIATLPALFEADPLLTVESSTKNIMPVFYGDLFTFGTYQYQMLQMKSFVHKERVLPKGIVFDSATVQPQKIYFIIGETARRDHFSLYGYPVKTTPFLDSLNQDRSVDFSYYKGVAPAPLTREALRIILSFASISDPKPFFEQKNIIELAREAGYETNWISNQDRVSVGDGYIGFVGSRSDYVSFRAITTQGKLDDLNLVDIVKKRYKPDKKQFFVIHLIGSHHLYEERYDDVDRQSIQGNDIVADFDRSIHHTDRVFREVYHLAQKDPSAVIYYFSDHGEIIGKGHAMGWLQDYLAPVFAISTDTTIVNTKPLIEKYVDRETSLINTSSTIYIMSEILGYKVPQNYVDMSIADGKFVLDKDFRPILFSKVKKAVE
ncbi:MAG: phosphoethanolamine transferase, partial [Dysgonomonas sp.]